MKNVAIGTVKLTKHLLITVCARLVYFFRINDWYQNSNLNQFFGINNIYTYSFDKR